MSPTRTPDRQLPERILEEASASPLIVLQDQPKKKEFSNDWLSDDRKRAIERVASDGIPEELRQSLDSQWDNDHAGQYHKPSKKEDIEIYGDTVMRMYLKDVAKTRLLTPQGEIYLSGLLAGDDIQVAAWAYEKFIECNTRLVIFVANKFRPSHNMDMMDMIQEGNLGLRHAVLKFDPRRGFAFSTPAVKWIKQAIQRRKNADDGAIHMDTEVGRVARLMLDEFKEYTNTAYRAREELRARGYSEDKIELITQAMSALYLPSLNSIIDDNDGELSDVIPGASDINPNLGRVMIKQAMDDVRTRIGVTDEELQCLYLKYYGNNGEGMKIPDITRVTGFSYERVRRSIAIVEEGLRYVLGVTDLFDKTIGETKTEAIRRRRNEYGNG